MNSFDLEPRYSTSEVPGKCIKCLAEEELNDCLRELLKGKSDSKELRQRFERLAAFLTSPESKALRDEAERYLAEGKRVRLRLHSADGKPGYELEVS